MRVGDVVQGSSSKEWFYIESFVGDDIRVSYMHPNYKTVRYLDFPLTELGTVWVNMKGEREKAHELILILDRVWREKM